tara:strand:- start:18838 stop:19320 length:483 start_codon:yes stop_codon:yes gene_type:complete
MQRTLLAIMICFFVSPSYAKNLEHRLGVGYSNTFSFELPSLALSYYPSSRTNIGVALGVNTEDDQSKFGFLFKAFRVIFEEENLNFLMGGGAAVISDEQNGRSDSGFEVSALAAAEYFFTGLDSLAFRFEAGIGIVSQDDGVTFRTIGESPISAGVIFYF